MHAASKTDPPIAAAFEIRARLLWPAASAQANPTREACSIRII